MRGAGCTYNDILDRKLDAGVERTRNRPLPSGRVTIGAAAAFLVAQALVGLVVLLCFNRFSVWLGLASIGVVLVYPLMKRVTSWPQAALGLAFSWGALMGWSATFASLALPPSCSTRPPLHGRSATTRSMRFRTRETTRLSASARPRAYSARASSLESAVSMSRAPRWRWRRSKTPAEAPSLCSAGLPFARISLGKHPKSKARTRRQR